VAFVALVALVALALVALASAQQDRPSMQVNGGDLLLQVDADKKVGPPGSRAAPPSDGRLTPA
jgi:hypothetical protein